MCTGNICRSPFAEFLAASLTDGGRLRFASAGTATRRGLAATETMTVVAAEFGVDLREHRSRPLSDAEEPDLVLCMEDHHRHAVADRFPDLDESAIRLLGKAPIADPFGSDITTYRACARQIADALSTLQSD